MEIHDKIKVLEGENYIVIFDGKAITLRIVPSQLYHTCMQKGVDYAQHVQEGSTLFKNIQCSHDNMLQFSEDQINSSEYKSGESPSLLRLTLNVSNACNMACKYCYASGGTYNTTEMLMNQNTALNTINFFNKNFSSIEHVNFFGGEPTLMNS